jgi:hypothetical protein
LRSPNSLPMPNNPFSELEQLRAEIAAAAARMIAEDGADYGSAKQKAVRQILGNTKMRGDILPDNAQIEEEVRQYNELFLSDTQPARLQHLRALALRVMEEFARFNPYLTGAVLNGTAGEHSDIHLQLFAESPKDVEIFLLNKNIDFEVSETPHYKGRRNEPVETVSFMREREGVHLALYAIDDLRNAPKSSLQTERANLDAVRVLVTQGDPS